MLKAVTLVVITYILFITCSASYAEEVSGSRQSRPNLIIVDLYTESSVLDNASDDNINEYNKVKPELIIKYSDVVESELSRKGYFAEIIRTHDIEKIDKPVLARSIILQSKIKEIHFGNRFKRIARFLTAGIPFLGTGQVKIEIATRLLSGKDNKVLDTDESSENTGWEKGPIDYMFVNFMGKLGRESAEFVESFVSKEDYGQTSNSGYW